ncbi:hypothetical protein [Leptothrix ochracea]|uniref:hypothetical protein n=1 Tax=Leptothrix ochracea TaxID=735331 RepID=UPI0034E26BF6
MADSKDPTKSGDGFFRKVARFVVNPTTDWTDLNNSTSQSAENDPARTELKAMIERKRRNDFVRRREFDMLRKIRREGLTGEGIAGLEGLSRIDDSDLRTHDSSVRPDAGVKAKIDAIEQQMVGGNSRMGPQSGLGPASSIHGNAPGVSGFSGPNSQMNGPRKGSVSVRTSVPAMSESFFDSVGSQPSAQQTPMSGSDAFKPTAPMSLADIDAQASRSPTGGSPSPKTGVKQGRGSSNTQDSSNLIDFQPIHLGLGAQSNPNFGVEITELAHDPELDEAVISFANADFDQCERCLHTLISPSGVRARNAETWDVLFDLYRATGQQKKFDGFAMEYVQNFGYSAPQWYSLLHLAEEAGMGQYKQQLQAIPRNDSAVSWTSPDVVSINSVDQLRNRMLQVPLPWVIDWRPLRRMETEACSHLTYLLREWADQSLEMRWIGGEHLLALLLEQAPTGAREASTAFWLLRMEIMRMANRTVEFDQTAMDYCMTYEVSPPSWTAARCSIRLSSDDGMTISPSLTAPSEGISTGFLDSDLIDETQSETASVEISGHMVGDISDRLKDMDTQIGGAIYITVSCLRLIRLDFVAAGDLLNWVVSRHNQGQSVTFENAHRLVALFCDAMGFKEHARIKIRHI